APAEEDPVPLRAARARESAEARLRRAGGTLARRRAARGRRRAPRPAAHRRAGAARPADGARLRGAARSRRPERAPARMVAGRVPDVAPALDGCGVVLPARATAHPVAWSEL